MTQPPRLIAIGDIHGHDTALRSLLEWIDPAACDTIVSLGDYVDRGPQPAGVVDCLLQLQRSCRLIPLLGNHEWMMLATYYHRAELPFWLACGGDSTLRSYGGSLDNVPDAHMDFFGQCHRYYETDRHFFVHANYDPLHDLSDQRDHVLLWQHLTHQIPGPHQNGKVALVGHTPQVSGDVLDLGHLLCIDTYCFGGKWLTAIDAESRQVWQVDPNGTRRTG
ncbi:MAG: metallophosphoesterase [Pirellulaceae bacterium]|nr:serine/threonine protein phosphatase [Planctomycetales bacterium]